MMSLIPPSLVILPLVLIIIYLLNQRHERKIKDSFDELIEPVKQDNLFDLPKANKPSGPATHEPYVPPSKGQVKLKDDLTNNRRLNTVIEQAQDQLKKPVKSAVIEATHVGARTPAGETKAQKLARVKRLQAELAKVQAKKRQLKKQQNSGKMAKKAQKPADVQKQLDFNQSYQSLKPTMNVRIKK